MSGSKERATLATLIKSGTGRNDTGWKSDLTAEIEKKATRVATMMLPHDLVIICVLDRKKVMAVSKGSVRCCMSARTANRISKTQVSKQAFPPGFLIYATNVQLSLIVSGVMECMRPFFSFSIDLQSLLPFPVEPLSLLR